MSTQRANVMYLSPHLDDAVLSCGGLMHHQIQAGTTVLVVTIFAGTPSRDELSAFAARLLADSGHLTDAVTARRREDERAARLLGAAHLHLEYPDAIYRFGDSSFLYLCDDDLFGTIHPSDRALISRITEDIAKLHASLEATIYAPLAVGSHVDHQLVREAALALRSDSHALVFYEDYPYVETPGALTRELARAGSYTWTEDVQELDEQDLALKIAAIAAYPSQIGTVFRGAQCVAQRVRDYALALSSGDAPVERYWRLSGSANSARDSASGCGIAHKDVIE